MSSIKPFSLTPEPSRKIHVSCKKHFVDAARWPWTSEKLVSWIKIDRVQRNRYGKTLQNIKLNAYTRCHHNTMLPAMFQGKSPDILGTNNTVWCGNNLSIFSILRLTRTSHTKGPMKTVIRKVESWFSSTYKSEFVRVNRRAASTLWNSRLRKNYRNEKKYFFCLFYSQFSKSSSYPCENHPKGAKK